MERCKWCDTELLNGFSYYETESFKDGKFCSQDCIVSLLTSQGVITEGVVDKESETYTVDIDLSDTRFSYYEQLENFFGFDEDYVKNYYHEAFEYFEEKDIMHNHQFFIESMCKDYKSFKSEHCKDVDFEVTPTSEGYHVSISILF